jgi:hypothetical protein
VENYILSNEKNFIPFIAWNNNCFVSSKSSKLSGKALGTSQDLRSFNENSFAFADSSKNLHHL